MINWVSIQYATLYRKAELVKDTISLHISNTTGETQDVAVKLLVLRRHLLQEEVPVIVG